MRTVESVSDAVRLLLSSPFWWPADEESSTRRLRRAEDQDCSSLGLSQAMKTKEVMKLFTPQTSTTFSQSTAVGRPALDGQSNHTTTTRRRSRPSGANLSLESQNAASMLATSSKLRPLAGPCLASTAIPRRKEEETRSVEREQPGNQQVVGLKVLFLSGKLIKFNDLFLSLSWLSLSVYVSLSHTSTSHLHSAALEGQVAFQWHRVEAQIQWAICLPQLPVTFVHPI